MRHRGPAFALGLLLSGLCAGGAWAGEFDDCVRDASDKLLAAKSDFQRDFRDLIVRGRPDFEAIATRNMELQILLAAARRAKVDYLLAHDPDRIETGDGVSRFSNFTWSREDAAAHMEQSPAYRDMETRLSTLLTKNNDDPVWPSLREYFRSELSQSPDFEVLISRLQGHEGEVDAMIAHCHRD